MGRLRPCQERIPFLQRHVHGRRQTLFLPDVQQNRLGETCFGRSGRALQSASPSVDGSAGQGLPYVARRDLYYRVGDGLRGLADEFPPPDGRCGLRGRSLDAARGVARGALRLASDRRGLPRREPVRPALLFHAIDLLHAAAAFEVPGQSRRAGRAYQGALFGGCRYEGYGGPCRVPCRHDLPRDEEGRRVGRERLGVDERGHRRQRVRSAESRLQRPDEGEARLRHRRLLYGAGRVDELLPFAHPRAESQCRPFECDAHGQRAALGRLRAP